MNDNQTARQIARNPLHVDRTGQNGNQFSYPGEQSAGSVGDDIPQRSRSPNQASEMDRFGVAGLLSTIRNSDNDISSLAIGQDLTTLGLDLNSLE